MNPIEQAAGGSSRARVRPVLIGLSTLLCVLVLFLWLHSTDTLTIFWWNVGPPGTTRRWELHSIGGRVALLHCPGAHVLWSGRVGWDRSARVGVDGLGGIPEGLVAQFVPGHGTWDFGVAGFAAWWRPGSGRVSPGTRGVVMVPYWFVALTLAMAPWISVRRMIRRATRGKRQARGLCPECGYDLRATPGLCPECGA
jgi:hypothetical protein